MRSGQDRLVRWERRWRNSLKVGESSSGCETRPAKAEPGRPEASPYSGFGNEDVGA